MKFWLTCFGLLFVGAELFQWFAERGDGPLSGVWLILGGLGLAAASNAAHLPKLIGTTASDATASDETDQDDPARTQIEERTQKSLSVAEQSAEDSISFKVRLPWR